MKVMIGVATAQASVLYIPAIIFKVDKYISINTDGALKRKWVGGLKQCIEDASIEYEQIDLKEHHEENYADLVSKLEEKLIIKTKNESTVSIENGNELIFNIGGGQKNHILALIEIARKLHKEYKVTVVYANASSGNIIQYNFGEDGYLKSLDRKKHPVLSNQISEKIESTLMLYGFEKIPKSEKDEELTLYDSHILSNQSNIETIQDLFHLKDFRAFRYQLNMESNEFSLSNKGDEDLDLMIYKNFHDVVKKKAKQLIEDAFESKFNSNQTSKSHLLKYSVVKDWLKNVPPIIGLKADKEPKDFLRAIKQATEISETEFREKLEPTLLFLEENKISFHIPEKGSLREYYKGIVNNGMKIKDAKYFENVIIQNVFDFMNSTDISEINQIYSNIKLKNKKISPNIENAEHDILIHTKNLALISLDAKSFSYSKKEFDSKIKNLKDAGGRTIRLEFVLPFEPMDVDDIMPDNIKSLPFDYKSKGMIFYAFAPEFEKTTRKDDFTLYKFKLNGSLVYSTHKPPMEERDFEHLKIPCFSKFLKKYIK